MSGDYYGGIAGELADQGEATREFEAWLNEYTRHELPSSYEQLLAAFMAGRQSVERDPAGAKMAETWLHGPRDMPLAEDGT